MAHSQKDLQESKTKQEFLLGNVISGHVSDQSLSRLEDEDLHQCDTSWCGVPHDVSALLWPWPCGHLWHQEPAFWGQSQFKLSSGENVEISGTGRSNCEEVFVTRYGQLDSASREGSCQRMGTSRQVRNYSNNTRHNTKKYLIFFLQFSVSHHEGPPW